MDSEPNDIILWQPYGGLGDNLQYSTLPELFAARGHRVFISHENRVRNPEIHDLVWGHNPYVAGVSERPPNAGAVHHERFMKLPRTSDFIRRWEAVHGLEPVNDHPKIYYPPKRAAWAEGKILLDITSVSTHYEPQLIREYVSYTARTFGYAAQDILQVGFRTAVATQGQFRLEPYGEHVLSSIFEYCDLIASCRALITVFSGAAVLASAIKGRGRQPMIHCVLNRNQYNRKFYVFDNAEYTVV